MLSCHSDKSAPNIAPASKANFCALRLDGKRCPDQRDSTTKITAATVSRQNAIA